MESHSVNCHPTEVTFPPLSQPAKADTWFSGPRGMRVDLVGWLRTEMMYLPKDSYLSPVHLESGCQLIQVHLSPGEWPWTDPDSSGEWLSTNPDSLDSGLNQPRILAVNWPRFTWRMVVNWLRVTVKMVYVRGFVCVCLYDYCIEVQHEMPQDSCDHETVVCT